MTFSYNIQSPSNGDMVRLLIGDTNGSDDTTYIFHDEEITTFLSLGETVAGAAALACRAIAVDTAKQAVAFGALNNAITIDRTKVPKYFIDLAEKLESGLFNSPIEGVRSIQTHVNVFGIDETEYVSDDEIYG